MTDKFIIKCRSCGSQDCIVRDRITFKMENHTLEEYKDIVVTCKNCKEEEVVGEIL